MIYHHLKKGTFSQRLNRFVAEVYLNGQKERVHVKNTGRLRELLLQGVEVILEESHQPNRKTKYSLIAVKKDGRWVNIDSQAPNAVAYEAIREGRIAELKQIQLLKKEVKYHDSRFDFYFETKSEKGFIEVKGVTLEKNGIALFPDAPTSRGTKHIWELVKAGKEGYKGILLFIIQMEGCRCFAPNRYTDPDFADALVQASRHGVEILAYETKVSSCGMDIGRKIPVELTNQRHGNQKSDH
ncbi:DNA/RNA nuclease SfsA [Ureibacillus terrenus]|uniref:DNA/RNA nuclease SfsA n=1 Tax=Ureibacillus terrenus TaxID=118246 RepID=UPI002E1A59EA|nr:DNA/RNA nuclease SfsA [Ureibacillus terrenus]